MITVTDKNNTPCSLDVSSKCHFPHTVSMKVKLVIMDIYKMLSNNTFCHRISNKTCICMFFVPHIPFLLDDISLMPLQVSPDDSNSEHTPIQTTCTACQLMSLASLLPPTLKTETLT